MAKTDFSRFIPPNLRQPLSDLGGLGYQLLDNLVGFDDDYDTTGELLARSLREDPVGTASSVASGVLDSVRGAYEDPLGVLSNMGDEFSTAYEMLSTPMDPNASREELGQRLEAATLLASVVPAVGATARATRAAVPTDLPNDIVPSAPVTLYHSSDNPNLSLGDIEIVREGARQGRRGRATAGFYTSPDADYAARYGENTYEVELQPWANIQDETSAEALMRISPERRQEYLDQGVDVLRGTDIRGLPETVILNRDAISQVRGATPNDIAPDAPDPFANVQAPAAIGAGTLLNDQAELAPPPAEINVPTVADDLGARAADFDRLTELRDAGIGDLPDGEREEVFGLLRRQDTGEFDDLMSEEDLRNNYRVLLQEGFNGMLSRQALLSQGLPEAEVDLIRDRYDVLEARFPGVYFEVGEELFGAQDQFPDDDIDFPINDSAYSSVYEFFLPETAPASQFNEANPYNTSAGAVSSPLSWMGQGVAGLYSRSARASQDLRQPAYGDINQLRRELEARGAPPKELDLQMDYLQDLFEESPTGRVAAEDIQGMLGNAPGLQVSRTEKYGGYGPRGGTNYTSTVYNHPSVEQGPDQAYGHFGGVGEAPPLFHTRAAQYEITTPDGTPANTHHVLEIQSDWAQHRQTLPSSNTSRENIQREARNLMREGRIDEAEALVNRPTRAEFDEMYPAPLVKNENDWVDAGVRQNLVDAVNSGSDWITFGNGRQASEHVFMPRAAAERFYDKQVPASVERVLRKFSREAGIEIPELQDLPFVDGDTVKGLQITPELRQALLEKGLPSFRDGGLVAL